MSGQTFADPLQLTAQIVTAHVSHNRLEADELPALIASVYQSLTNVTKTEAPAAAASPTPAVPVKKSVFPDYIVCLEDGKKLKMLKRHLKTSYDMTPEQYRTKWGLPREYPMVAPSYAAHRSGLAKQIGLGRKNMGVPSGEGAQPEPDAEGEPEVTKLPARRAKGSKAKA